MLLDMSGPIADATLVAIAFAAVVIMAALLLAYSSLR